MFTDLTSLPRSPSSVWSGRCCPSEQLSACHRKTRWSCSCCFLNHQTDWNLNAAVASPAYLCSCMSLCVPSPQLNRYLQQREVCFALVYFRKRWASCDQNLWITPGDWSQDFKGKKDYYHDHSCCCIMLHRLCQSSYFLFYAKLSKSILLSCWEAFSSPTQAITPPSCVKLGVCAAEDLSKCLKLVFAIRGYHKVTTACSKYTHTGALININAFPALSNQNSPKPLPIPAPNFNPQTLTLKYHQWARYCIWNYRSCVRNQGCLMLIG